MKQLIEILDFEVSVKLGCSKEERSFVQPVRVSILIEFNSNCKGFESDQLSDAIDYVSLTEIINSVAQKKEFNLIENLNFNIHQALEQKLIQQNYKAQLTTTTHKLRPPVFNLQGGVKSTCKSQF